MSFYQTILKEKELDSQSINNIWEVSLTEQEFEELKRQLKYARQWTLAPKDAALYYAIWWKRIYDGGRTSKELVFNSIEREDTPDLDASEFYKMAKLGGQQLGYSWIQRQNTLYFRTLLLQGGLPLRHISNNEGHYKRFLLEVLELQPESVEEINARPDITSLLPDSSRNNDIFQSCLDIVNAILDNDDKYDHLFEENRSLLDIVTDLRARKNEIGRKTRLVKPKTYWVLKQNDDNCSISLQLGFADTYSPNALTKAFGVEFTSKNFQFYIDEILICVFRRKIDGKYQTHWKDRSQIQWDGDEKLPNCYLLGNNERHNIPGFIATVPSFYKPTLWEEISENKWRLVRGNSIRSSSGLLLYPGGWESELLRERILLYDKELFYSTFEGEATISKDKETKIYRSNVSVFDWSIIGDKPNWLRKSDMPIIRNWPKVRVFNEDGELVPSSDYEIFIREHLADDWRELEYWTTLPLGCLDVKIQYNGIIAHDVIYKVGRFDLEYNEQQIHHSGFEIFNSQGFNLNINETELVSVTQRSRSYELVLNTEHLKIPLGIKARLKRGTQKSVQIELDNPFQGVALVNKQGDIIDEHSSLCLKDLNGIRILTRKDNDSTISFRNYIRDDVIINKNLNGGSMPLMFYTDVLNKLYHLEDVMNHENEVAIKIFSDGQTKSYSVKNYTHSIILDTECPSSIRLSDTVDIDLLAIPLNCPKDKIELIPLYKEGDFYKIPEVLYSQQFIIISSNDSDARVLPRFVNVDANYTGTDRNERIEDFNQQMLESGLEADIWQEMLVYFKICKQQAIPFSTLDQLRAISQNSEAAAKAFFYLGVNQYKRTEFIQQDIPDLERDLGFCFHWVQGVHWGNAINEVVKFVGEKYYSDLTELLSEYLEDNNLKEIFPYLSGKYIVDTEPVLQPEIQELRMQLGARVLNQLPHLTPHVNENYRIPINRNMEVKLLINSAISVAESIAGVQEISIWGGNDLRKQIRRNIQYSQYLNSKFYLNVILHVLNKLS